MDETHISKFNRSFARSEPNLPHCRQINVTEYFGNTGNNHSLIRHYSVKELQCGYLEYGYQLQANSPHINYDLDQLHNNDYCFEETLKKDFNDSPMDIDQSEEYADISIRENCSYETKLIGKSLNNLNKMAEEIESVNKIEELIISDTRNELSKKMGREIILIFVIGLFLSLGFLIYTDVNLSDIELNDVENDLKLTIFNQKHVVDSLLFNLNKIHTSTEFKKVLNLVGSTGVGKTLILNRLKKNYPEKLFFSLNYQLNKEVLEQKNIFFTNKCFILFIDDLKINQLENIENFIKNIQSECVFIILAFNIQDTNDNLTHIVHYEHFKEISQFFIQKKILSETLMLNTMNKINLESFIIDVIKKRGMNPEKYINFIKNLVENHDVDNYGFKGIIPKINLLE